MSGFIFAFVRLVHCSMFRRAADLLTRCRPYSRPYIWNARDTIYSAFYSALPADRLITAACVLVQIRSVQIRSTKKSRHDSTDS